MAENYTCECGERVDPKGSFHQCPGAPNDRLDCLEADVESLQELTRGAYHLRRLWLAPTMPGAGKILYAGESQDRAAEVLRARGTPMVPELWMCAVLFEDTTVVDLLPLAPMSVLDDSLDGAEVAITPPDV
jgi:hypothetical protein